MKVHILKVWCEWFGDIKSGKKQLKKLLKLLD